MKTGSLAAVLVATLAVMAQASLVAHWEFEGNLDDSVGNYDGTAVGTIGYGSSIYGGNSGSQCLLLTSNGAPGGDDGVVVTGSESLLDGPTEMTVSVWYKAETPTSFPYWDSMVSKIGPLGTKGDGLGWAAGRFGGSSGQVSFFYRNDGYYPVASGQSITDGEWHNIVCTYASASIYGVDGKARGRIYIDGQLVANRYQDEKEAILSSSSSPITIGVTIFNGIYKDGIYGRLDDVRLYDNFMSDADILALYQATNVPEPIAMLLLATGAGFCARFSRKNR